ncbi:MAG: hypothetical protein K2W95_35300 [Candidatus Obscuribacterales bacterium]|nr:hypothetical protein [Candidatus Obscuribacterales bacterium]
MTAEAGLSLSAVSAHPLSELPKLVPQDEPALDLFENLDSLIANGLNRTKFDEFLGSALLESELNVDSNGTTEKAESGTQSGAMSLGSNSGYEKHSDSIGEPTFASAETLDEFVSSYVDCIDNKLLSENEALQWALEKVGLDLPSVLHTAIHAVYSRTCECGLSRSRSPEQERLVTPTDDVVEHAVSITLLEYFSDELNDCVRSIEKNIAVGLGEEEAVDSAISASTTAEVDGLLISSLVQILRKRTSSGVDRRLKGLLSDPTGYLSNGANKSRRKTKEEIRQDIRRRVIRILSE